MKNHIVDLRNHLFECIEKVKDGDMDIDQARVVSDLSQRLINSAKVEVDYIRATGADRGSGFMDEKPGLKSIEGKKAR